MHVLKASLKHLLGQMTMEIWTPIVKLRFGGHIKKEGKRFYILTNEFKCYFVVKNACKGLRMAS